MHLFVLLDLCDSPLCFHSQVSVYLELIDLCTFGLQIFSIGSLPDYKHDLHYTVHTSRIQG
jgi:hypothetical protein